jgi:AraC-like DNA-binding protein
LVLGFQFKGRISAIADNAIGEVPLTTSGVTGISDRVKVFRNFPNTGSVLVFFKEGGAASFFKQPLHELFRESVSLENFMLRSELLLTEEQLCSATTDEARISVVEQFLVARMTPVKTDTLVAAALAMIYRSKGNIRVSALARELHMSQSPLEKRFRQSVGTSAKKFASIVRMKHVIASFSPEKSLTEIGYEAGFYDQAHFIKEFKTFTGETPAAFFSSSIT